MSDNDELATSVAKAIEILQHVQNRLRGGKHAPAPLPKEEEDPTSFRLVTVSFWDIIEKDDADGNKRIRAKIRDRSNEDFYIDDLDTIKRLDPVKRDSMWQIQSVPIRDKEGKPIRNKAGSQIFRVKQIREHKVLKDGDPGSAFDAAHEIPF